MENFYEQSVCNLNLASILSVNIWRRHLAADVNLHKQRASCFFGETVSASWPCAMRKVEVYVTRSS